VAKDYIKKAKVLARKGTIFSKLERYTDAITALEKSLLEENNPKVKDELSKIKKIKKEKEAKDYINPALADQHNEQGTALYKEGNYSTIQASSLWL
jgi:tetratricopeptide (TPR) repeat protein